MRPPIRFVTTSDGVRIAYAVHGHGPPMVFVRGWVSHLDVAWDTPDSRAYLEALGGCFTLVRYDMRGNGLSQRKVDALDMASFSLDLEAVMDELRLNDVVLYGQSYGGPIAISYAASHPDRVARLILDGTFASGERLASPERWESFLSMLHNLPDAGYVVLSHLTSPDAPYRPALEQAITPDVAVHLYSLAPHIDVSDAARTIRTPTLVMHRQRSQAISSALGRELASLLPNGQFAMLPGASHNPWEGDAVSVLDTLGNFLGVQFKYEPAGVATARDESRRSMTILFTDIEASTEMTQRLGDDAAQEMLRAHNSIVRRSLRAHHGTEVKHTGDGIMASFSSASDALACAIAIQRAMCERNAEAATPMLVRVGINAGEPVAEGDDLFGTAVQMARRICDSAQPGEVLVSNVVRELTAGKGFDFVDAGEVAAKGFADVVRIYRLRWAEDEVRRRASDNQGLRSL